MPVSKERLILGIFLFEFHEALLEKRRTWTVHKCVYETGKFLRSKARLNRACYRFRLFSPVFFHKLRNKINNGNNCLHVISYHCATSPDALFAKLSLPFINFWGIFESLFWFNHSRIRFWNGPTGEKKNKHIAKSSKPWLTSFSSGLFRV